MPAKLHTEAEESSQDAAAEYLASSVDKINPFAAITSKHLRWAFSLINSSILYFGLMKHFISVNTAFTPWPSHGHHCVSRVEKQEGKALPETRQVFGKLVLCKNYLLLFIFVCESSAKIHFFHGPLTHLNINLSLAGLDGANSKNFFYFHHEDSQTFEQAAQGGCAVSITGHFQYPAR